MIRRALLVAAACCLLSTPSRAALERPSAGTRIAHLLLTTPVRSAPTTSSTVLVTIPPVRPLTAQQTALPVLAERVDDHGIPWLRVRLPGRPNGRSGWIRKTSARLTSTPWRLVVVRARREALLVRDGRTVALIPVVVGAPGTPTPRGAFFVVEHVPQPVGSSLGAWALATSAHSNVLQEFDGGPGQIALHGRHGPLALAPLGSAASHGCVRFADGDIARLARLLPNGTPIEIR